VADAHSIEAALKDDLILAGQVGCSRLIVNINCMDVISITQDGGNSIGAATEIYEV
jgi:translation elongation factor EF-1alpha